MNAAPRIIKGAPRARTSLRQLDSSISASLHLFSALQNPRTSAMRLFPIAGDKTKQLRPRKRISNSTRKGLSIPACPKRFKMQLSLPRNWILVFSGLIRCASFKTMKMTGTLNVCEWENITRIHMSPSPLYPRQGAVKVSFTYVLRHRL